MLFALGSNASGQLGVGHNEDVDIPTKVVLPGDDGLITRIAAGGNHALLLSKDGRLRTTSSSGFGRSDSSNAAEHEMNQIFIHVPNGVDSPCQVWKLCSATWAASVLVTKNSQVLSYGIGQRGELGLGDAVMNASCPIPVPGFPPPGLDVVDLSASMGHAAAVLSDGSVWGWGNGRKGQLGKPAGICWSPRRVEGISFRAERAVCGRDFTFIVGSPKGGEHLLLGNDKHSLQSSKPSSVAGWKQVGATWGSLFVLKEDGQLLAWGRNDHGQLGPKNLPSLDMIATGSEHVLALTNAKEVLAWGWGEHGNCGTPTGSNGDVQGHYNVLQIPGRCRYIAAGCATSWIDCEDGL